MEQNLPNTACHPVADG